MKFDFCLSAIAVKSNALHLSVKGIRIQIGIVREVGSNGRANRSIGTGVPQCDWGAISTASALLASYENRSSRNQNFNI